MKVEKRVEKLNKVRNQGFIPGVIYGKELESTSIQVDKKSLMEAFKSYGKSKIFKVKLGRKVHDVYIKDIDFRASKIDDIIHFGLLKVSASDTITAEIPITITGKDEIVKQGLIVQQMLSLLPVTYPVTESMDVIELNISHLNVGDALYVKDITLPENFSTAIDGEEMVANITYPRIKETEGEQDTAEEYPEETQEK